MRTSPISPGWRWRSTATGCHWAASRPRSLEGFSGEQRFFLGFGQVWRNKYREPYLRRVLMTDGHSPGEYRASTVRNIDAWYQAFGATPGQTLFLTPEQRVRIW
ncbi:M13-type metalloendopeptidase [Archangium gephyra]|uniref:M13-type metalloendopeptidase n=1 Tax=Archangium gephyra TaxID=48 RepID=UPI003B7DB719